MDGLPLSHHFESVLDHSTKTNNGVLLFFKEKSESS